MAREKNARDKWRTSAAKHRVKAIPAATQVYEPPIPPASCKAIVSPAPGCRRVLQLHHTERLAGVPAIFSLMLATAKEFGFEIAHPYMRGGSLLWANPKAHPMSDFFAPSGFTKCEPNDRPAIHLRFSRTPWEDRAQAYQAAVTHERKMLADLEDEVANISLALQSTTHLGLSDCHGNPSVRHNPSLLRDPNTVRHLRSACEKRKLTVEQGLPGAKINLQRVLGAAIEPTEKARRHASNPSGWNEPQNFRANIPAAWWCSANSICILDWTPCIKGRPCPPSTTWANSSTPRELMGSVIKGAFDLLERDCPGATLITPRGAIWYKSHEFRGTVEPVTRLSQGMERVAARIANMYQRCPKGYEIGAMLRIAQEPLFRKDVSVIESRCNAAITRLNSLANVMQPRPHQTCRHVIATDYFVMADSGLPKAHKQALQRCFAVLQDYSNSSLWMRIGSAEMQYGVAEDPHMYDLWKKDNAGFHSVLELAMLARADVCIEASHMAQTIVNLLRGNSGKPSCQHLMSNSDPRIIKSMGAEV